MIHFSNLHSFIKNDNIAKSQAIHLKAGQIFHGQVLKVLPESIALVQLGGLKLHAKLDAPLMTNVNYWFQVVPNETMVELKLMNPQAVGSANNGKMEEGVTRQMVDQLLKQAGLPNTKENNQLIRMLVKEQLLFSHETLKTTSQWLKAQPNIITGLEAIKLAMQRDLPQTPTVLNSLYAFQTKEPLSSTLANLFEDIRSLESKSPALQQLSLLLNQLTSVTKEAESVEILHQLLKKYFQSGNSSEQKTVQSLLNKFGVNEAQLANAKNSVIQSIQNNRVNLPQALTQLLNLEELSPKEFIAQLLKILDANPQNTSLKNEGLKLIMDAFNLKQILLKGTLSSPESEIVNKIQQQLLNEAQGKWDTGKEVQTNLKHLLNTLGLQYEQALNQSENEQQIAAKQAALKPLLMKALEESLAPQLKEKIEQLVQRLTGQQLLTTNDQTASQLLMQIPVLLGNHVTDLTIQWNGRKKKDGKIDPDYCRILFYLELENLKETLVDVNVQNRVVNIQIYNETTGIDKLIKNFQPLLKAQLDGMNYHLSSIKVTNYSQITESKNPNHMIPLLQSFQSTTNGVDYRV